MNENKMVHLICVMFVVNLHYEFSFLFEKKYTDSKIYKLNLLRLFFCDLRYYFSVKLLCRANVNMIKSHQLHNLLLR